MTGLGYMVRSLMEEAIISGRLDLTILKPLESLPLNNKDSISFKKAKIIDEDNKIISKTDKRIGAFLCRNIRVMPCETLTV
jgi:hypothetical protein